jgi:hypothetical protein
VHGLKKGLTHFAASDNRRYSHFDKASPNRRDSPEAALWKIAGRMGD